MRNQMNNIMPTVFRHVTGNIGSEGKSWALGLALAVLSFTVSAENKFGHPPRGWLDFYDQALGVQFKYPPRWKVWTQGKEIFLDKPSSVQKKQPKYFQFDSVDRAFNGRSLSNDGLYLLHFSTGAGNFESANNQHMVFKRGDKKDAGHRLNYGRFDNPAAKKIQTQQWSGFA
jgi:hypothetical protein